VLPSARPEITLAHSLASLYCVILAGGLAQIFNGGLDAYIFPWALVLRIGRVSVAIRRLTAGIDQLKRDPAGQKPAGKVQLDRDQLYRTSDPQSLYRPRPREKACLTC
jgi:hypothetical protein